MRLLQIAALLLLLQACQKDKNTPTPANATPTDYLPMKTGSYWAYKVTADNGNIPGTTATHDTIRVVGDTLINGITYYQLKTTGMQTIPNQSLIGSSNGLLVYTNGNRFPLSLIANDTTAAYTADDGLDYRVYRSGNLDTTISVPLGGYQTVESIMDFYYLQGSPPNGIANPRPVYTYYAKNVGLVKCVTWYAAGPGLTISELEGYHLEP